MNHRAKGSIHVLKEDFLRILADDKYKDIGWKDPEDGSWGSHRHVIQDTETKTTVGFRISSSWNPNVNYYLKEEFLRSLPDCGGIDIEGIKEAERKARELRDWKQKNKLEDFNEIQRKKRVEKTEDELFSFQFLEKNNVIPYTPSEFNIDVMINLLREMWFDRPKDNVRNTTSIKEVQYIEIQEGWMGTDDDPYWGFACTIPVRGTAMMTGKGGFLKFVEDGMYWPIKYNGVILPESKYNEFLEYCKK